MESRSRCAVSPVLIDARASGEFSSCACALDNVVKAQMNTPAATALRIAVLFWIRRIRTRHDVPYPQLEFTSAPIVPGDVSIRLAQHTSRTIAGHDGPNQNSAERVVEYPKRGDPVPRTEDNQRLSYFPYAKRTLARPKVNAMLYQKWCFRSISEFRRWDWNLAMR